jgi:hypothetical protein
MTSNTNVVFSQGWGGFNSAKFPASTSKVANPCACSFLRKVALRANPPDCLLCHPQGESSPLVEAVMRTSAVVSVAEAKAADWPTANLPPPRASSPPRAITAHRNAKMLITNNLR